MAYGMSFSLAPGTLPRRFGCVRRWCKMFERPFAVHDAKAATLPDRRHPDEAS
ncbi:hypothetical protein LPU83_pLPU83d_0271 (plasmid) [Rhizobium favelukesii]|uniref:Uncharacterized protein n=1 Tax=Rhizobium favelukesii TaxID=348824 RepID=W6RKI1_9HYPH|nr:hypothetical protein LPU83_pLPU83d_0271 [Rhizobium favelukesii]